MPAAPLRDRLRRLARAGALGRAPGGEAPPPPARTGGAALARRPDRPDGVAPAAQAAGGASPGPSPARRR
ncbi:MAG: hypothetical protein RLZZ501_614 [Pseudomonadota bacterium]|jgi:hypothetical protein